MLRNIVFIHSHDTFTNEPTTTSTKGLTNFTFLLNNVEVVTWRAELRCYKAVKTTFYLFMSRLWNTDVAKNASNAIDTILIVKLFFRTHKKFLPDKLFQTANRMSNENNRTTVRYCFKSGILSTRCQGEEENRRQFPLQIWIRMIIR